MDQDWTPYSYCSGKPTTRTDPDGRANAAIVAGNKAAEEAKAAKDLADDVNRWNWDATIDPGHGDNPNKWTDPGCSSGDLKEKDIALKISGGILGALQKKGFKVQLTRTEDVKDAGKKLQWRIEKADGSHFFISIHVNASTDAKASGFAVFTNKKGEKLGKSIADAVDVFDVNNGSSLGEAYYLLNPKHQTGPAALVEAGFITNASDKQKLATQSDLIAEQIAQGIASALGD